MSSPFYAPGLPILLAEDPRLVEDTSWDRLASTHTVRPSSERVKGEGEAEAEEAAVRACLESRKKS